MQQTFHDFAKSHIDTLQAQLYTSMPALVTKVSVKGKSTVVSVQPLLNRRFLDGTVVQEPVLGNVPIQWPSGGGCYVTMPIEVGDNVALHFSMRALTEWRNSDGTNPSTATDKRLHSLSDVFAVPCLYPYQKGIEADSDGVHISSGKTEIRILKDGTIELGEGATEKLLKGDDFMDKFLSHTHTAIDTVGATVTTKLTTGVTTILSVPDTLEAPPNKWSTTLSEVSKTL